MYRAAILIASVSLVKGQAAYHAPAAYDESPKPYVFEYTVKDAEYGANFGQQEASDAKVVTGTYNVALPDGRTQIVTYHADPLNEGGFVAEVTYEGKAAYPTEAVYNKQPVRQFIPVHKAPTYAPRPTYGYTEATTPKPEPTTTTTTTTAPPKEAEPEVYTYQAAPVVRVAAKPTVEEVPEVYTNRAASVRVLAAPVVRVAPKNPVVYRPVPAVPVEHSGEPVEEEPEAVADDVPKVRVLAAPVVQKAAPAEKPVQEEPAAAPAAPAKYTEAEVEAVPSVRVLPAPHVVKAAEETEQPAEEETLY